MDIFIYIFHIISIILFAYLAFSGIYIFVFAFAGIFYKDPVNTSLDKRKIAVFIPGYKEDEVIVEVAEKALEQSYPGELYKVIIIADSFQDRTLKALKELPVTVLEVSFEKSTKAKALNAALDYLPEDYQIAVVLDADNVMEYDFLEKLNHAFSEKTKVIQGHRMAKNSNTNFAILDALSEEINNHIFRKGHRAVNLSSAIIGSGVGFDYQLFKEYMKKAKAIGGFDKELELNMLSDGHKIEYLNNARVYDEKIQSSNAFEGQRRRWLSAQFIYFRRFSLQGIKSALKFKNIDFIDKVIQMILVPRILLIGLLIIVNLVSLLLNLTFNKVGNTLLMPNLSWWFILLIIVLLAFVISIPRSFYNSATLKALVSLPKGFWVMFLSLIKIKGANKRFIHTSHGKIPK